MRSAAGLGVICLGTLIAPLDSSVNIALPSISSAFGVALGEIRWIVIAFVLTYSSLLLIFGKLGDLIGYRVIFQLGMAVAAAGFAACGASQSFGSLLGARVLQGIGIALTLSCAPALATTLFDERHRTRVLGVYAAATAAGSALGPILGGLLVERFGWSAVFWGRAPLALAALALSALIPPPPARLRAAVFDALGAVLLVAWLTALLLAFAVSQMPGAGLYSITLTGVFMVALVAFVRHERHHAEPIIRPALFRDLDFTAMNLMSVAVNYAAFSVLLLAPFFIVRTLGFAPASGGLMLALAAGGAVAGASFAGRLVQRIAVGPIALAGAGLCAAGLALVAALAETRSVTLVASGLVLHGLGAGLFQVAYTDLVTASLPLKDRGVAGSLTVLTRTIGVVSGATGHAAVQRLAEQAALAGGAQPEAAFLAGFRFAFAVAAGVAVLGLAAGLCRAGLRRGNRGLH